MNSADFQKNKENIIKKIQEKAKILKCPVCGETQMILGDGFFAHDIQLDLKNRTMGGLNIPTIPIVCSNCGLIREFAAGVLGLLPKEEKKDEEVK
jgi:hypothetical protein